MMLLCEAAGRANLSKSEAQWRFNELGKRGLASPRIVNGKKRYSEWDCQVLKYVVDCESHLRLPPGIAVDLVCRKKCLFLRRTLFYVGRMVRFVLGVTLEISIVVHWPVKHLEDGNLDMTRSITSREIQILDNCEATQPQAENPPWTSRSGNTRGAVRQSSGGKRRLYTHWGRRSAVSNTSERST